jgi:phosphatidate cytidylyltransferase
MKTRAITGFFFIIVMLASLLLGQFVFSIYYLILTSLCLWEFYGLIKQTGLRPNTIIGLFNGAALFFVFALMANHPDIKADKLLFLLPITFSIIFIQELFKKAEAPFSNIAYTFLGIIFATIPFTFFHGLAFIQGSFNFHFPMAFLLMLWANDTGAYLVGSKFGRTKLFERHSPKKTWEGFIGGLLITAIAAYIISIYYVDIALAHWLWIGVLISCFGTTGDLIESMFKRSINVKDSGGILPGHGGLLDRFDGLLIAAPIVYAYLYFVTNS